MNPKVTVICGGEVFLMGDGAYIVDPEKGTLTFGPMASVVAKGQLMRLSEPGYTVRVEYVAHGGRQRLLKRRPTPPWYRKLEKHKYSK